MTINRKLCPAGLKNNPNKNLTAINYITIHNTGNYSPTATAKNHADWLYGGSMSDGKPLAMSWHYTVDAKEIWQSFDDIRACWHAGDSSTGPGNSTSIGIEICVNDKAAFKAACDNAAWLTAQLLERYNLGIDRVVQHNRWAVKDCPKELRSGAWGVSWDVFIDRVKRNMGPLTPPPLTPPAPQVIYRVQVGAFNIKANADACLEKARAAGFKDAYIV